LKRGDLEMLWEAKNLKISPTFPLDLSTKLKISKLIFYKLVD